MRKKCLLTLAIVQLAAAIGLAVTTGIMYHQTSNMLTEPELKALAGTMAGYADTLAAYRELYNTMNQALPQYLETVQNLEEFFQTLHPLASTLHDLSQRGISVMGLELWPLGALREPAAHLSKMLPEMAATCSVTAQTLSKYDDRTHRQTLAAIDATIASLRQASGTLDQHAAKRNTVPRLMAVTGFLMAIAIGASSLSQIAAIRLLG
jgi:uncharacterized protein YukE